MNDATRTCPVCGTQLPPRKPGPGRNRIYCSQPCGEAARKAAAAGTQPKLPRARAPKTTHACESCGDEYTPRRNTQRYCSSTCAAQARRMFDRTPRTCPACGCQFTPRAEHSTYCSRECTSLHAMDNAIRACVIPGCSNKYRARGLCSTHYNQQHHPDRHPKAEVPCVVCGNTSTKVINNGRRPVCSFDCRYALQWGERKSERDARLEAERRSHAQLVGPVRFNKTTEPPTVTIPATFQRLVSAECRECGTWFIDHVEGRGGTIALTCSDLCARRWGRRGRRFVTTKIRNAIYDRDNWTCQLCQQPVTRDYDPDDMWSASLDHITPRSHGGTHDPSNLRLAHRYCNAIRSDAQLEDAWFISPSA